MFHFRSANDVNGTLTYREIEVGYAHTRIRIQLQIDTWYTGTRTIWYPHDWPFDLTVMAALFGLESVEGVEC